MQVWKELCVSEPSGLRFAFLWSPPCSFAQYSSRGRKKSRNLESRTQNQTSGLLCAVRPQLPHTAAGRRFADGFQGPERPLSVTSPLLLSLFLSLSVRHKQTPLRRSSQKKPSWQTRSWGHLLSAVLPLHQNISLFFTLSTQSIIPRWDTELLRTA